MRSRAWVTTAVLLFISAWTPVRAQDANDRYDGGLAPGDYLRVGYASVNPIHPEGSLVDWNRGRGVHLLWENWAIDSRGVSKLAFGLQGSYSVFPFNEQRFINDFVNGPNGRVLTASSNHATIYELGVVTRLRFPMPYVIPNIAVGFGFVNWRPGTIDYTAVGGTGTAKQGNRTGGSLSLSGGLDLHVVDRFFVFGDAAYTYGYTSFGSGLGGSGSACLQTSCDLLKNTQLGVIRGGLRVRVGR